MDPQDFINMQDLSQSMLQPQVSPKKVKTHASFSIPVKKLGGLDSFQFDSDMQPPTQNNSKQVSQSQSITQSWEQSGYKQRMRGLYMLQEQLQKQYLMLGKEEVEKKKFMKEIQDEMKNYYSLLIEVKRKSAIGEGGDGATEGQVKRFISQTAPKHCPNRIVTDDGFDNCSNFVKQVVINTSKHFQVAVTLLINCTLSPNSQDKGSIFINDYLCLVDFFVNVLYERVTETDPFLKEVTKLICALVGKLPKLKDDEKLTLFASSKQSPTSIKQPLINTNYQKILLILSVYLQKHQVQDYFDILSNSMLKKVQKISFNRAQNRSRTGVSLHQSKSIIDTEGSIDLEKDFMDPTSSFGFKLQQNWLEYLKPFESFNDQKRALAMSYLSQVYSEADLCPMSLKMVLRYFYESQFGYFEQKYPLKVNSEIKLLSCLRVWQLVQKEYLRGFSQRNAIQSMLFRQMSSSQVQILGDVVRMIGNFLGNKIEKTYYQEEGLLEVYKKSRKFIMKVVEKLLSFNEEKYSEFRRAVSGEVDGLRMKKNQSQVGKFTSKSSKKGNQQLFSSRTALTEHCIQSIVANQQEQSSMAHNKNATNTNKKPQLPAELIRIYGGCISFKQIQILLHSLKKIIPLIPNQRIINRVNRIFDMSPNLEFLTQHKLVKHPNQIQHLFIILLEHQFDPLISEDYRNLYSKDYHSDRVKNMVRQVMCQLKLKELSARVNKRQIVNKKKVNIREFELEDFKMFKKNKSPQKLKPQQPIDPHPSLLIDLLQTISNECSRSVEGTEVEFSLHKGVSIQLLKKIKYLLYLFHKSTELNESQILKEMLEEVRLRSAKMVQIYQHTKFGLLAAIGNIRHYKNLLISKKQRQHKISQRIKHIKHLESLHLNICLTSPFTRSHPEFSLRDNSPSKQLSSRSSVSIQTPKKDQKQTSSSFTKQKPSRKQSHSLTKVQITNEPSTVFIQPYNKYKYRISNADEIVVCETAECIHRDNIFMGLSYHATTVQEFVQMFSNFRELAENLFFAEFVIHEGVAKKVQGGLAGRLKQYPPVNHPMAAVYMSKKYQKLHYSIDKINAVLYEFIEYLISQKMPKDTQQPKQQTAEMRKVAKDIIFRGLHERLVKKIEKRIRVNLGNQRRRVSLRKREEVKGVEKTVKNGQLSELLKQFGDDDILEEHLLEQGESEKIAKSSNFEVNEQSQQIRSRKLSRSSQRSAKKQRQVHQTNLPKQQYSGSQQQPQRDMTVFQSRNDQILLLQIQSVKNSTYFQPQTTNQPPINESRQSFEGEFSTRQLEEVCARYVSNINKKETPEDKIELLRNVADIYKLIVKEQHSTATHNHCHETHYTLEKLIFRALLIAEPPNFITNLAFIQIFLHKDKLLSLEGKILTQFKQITQHIFQLTHLHHYLDTNPDQNHNLSADSQFPHNFNLNNTFARESPIP